MDRKLIWLGIYLVALAGSVEAQTTVTSSGTTATTGNVPYVSGATTTSTTVSPSPITVSGRNVGIGTTSPTENLVVYGNSADHSGINVFNDTYANNQGTLYLFKTGPSYEITNQTNAAVIESYNDLILSAAEGTGSPASFIRFQTGRDGYIAYDRMVIADTGNVGIGTTSPGAKLEVNGGLRFTADPAGTVQTTAWTGVLCGGDYAEAVNASGAKKLYEPGDVLVLTEDGKQDVRKSSDPYSTMVAGIYATKPGVIGRRQSLAKDGDDLPMAMVGIVPTKVSTENGPIHRGDLLVTSSVSGYAMKGTDRSRMLGAVIGKAMGSLESGRGVIEVLVTLQ